MGVHKWLIISVLLGGVNAQLFAETNYYGIGESGNNSSKNEETIVESQWPKTMVSGTLPVLYVNTEGGVPILDKVTDIPAGLWIEIPEKCSSKEFELGSVESPVALEIRGRGNSSWLQDKKPYKIKFEKKTEILGMPKHKHFALLPAQVSPVLGMELARQVGLGWAPRCEQVEFVLNDEYLGIYSLFESVKIDSNRLDIFEQEDLCEDEEIIPYGWLVEIDNYEDEYQFVIDEPGRTRMMVTYKTPEELSEKQYQWLYNEFSEIYDVIYSENPADREHWADYIDAKSMAQYFLVREILEDYDGFCGSMYMYRDNEGENSIWKMGPMWDPTFNAWTETNDWTMNHLPSFATWKILPEIFHTEAFANAFLEVWNEFYPSKMEHIKNYIVRFGEKCAEADIADTVRWPNKNAVISGPSENYLFGCMERKAKWIDANKVIEVNPSGIDSILKDKRVASVETFTLLGSRIENPSAGIYVRLTTYEDGSVSSEKIILK